MSHRVGAWIATGFLVMMLAGMALARPDCDKAPNSRWCRGTTTTTTILSSTTTTGQTTTTQPTTTSTIVATTSTTTAPTTTSSTAATTTTTGSSETINLIGDWVITGHDARTGFTVNGNGHQILISGTVDWDDFTIDNVSRVMFHDGAGPSELTNGTVSNSGSPELGFYPLHWHLNYDTTRGTLVESVTVVNGRHHAFVPHGSHGITFLNSTAIDTRGEAFWWDPPGTTNCDSNFRRFCTADNSNDIVVDGMVVDGVRVAEDDSSGFRLAGYELGAGSGNVIRNSVAKNIVPIHIKDCAGFQWPEAANMNDGGNVWIFENNHGESACHGIFVWQNDGNHHIIDGFTGGGIDHGAYGNNYDYRNVDVPYVEIHAEGWVMSDSRVGDAILRKHQGAGEVVWTNVTITGSIIVADAPDGSQIQPIDFIVNGGGNSCSDVVWSNPHPQTQVVIDGVSC